MHGGGSIAARAMVLLTEIENLRLSPPEPVSSLDVPPSPLRPSPSFSIISTPVSSQELVQKAQNLLQELTVQIQGTGDATKLDALLLLCDKLNTALVTLSSRSDKPISHSLRLKTGSLDGTRMLHASPTSMIGEGDEVPLTPRVDKGKARAESEPEEPEKVLSPSFMISESEDEDENYEEDADGGVTSPLPTDRLVWFLVYRWLVDYALTDPRVGWRKRGRYLEKVLSCSALQKWRVSMQVKSFDERWVLVKS